MTKIEKRKKRVKNKAAVVTGSMALVTFIVFLVLLGIPTSVTEIVCNSIVFFMLGLIFYCTYRVLIIAFDREEDANESKEFAESVLSSKVQTEVIHIGDGSEEREFICGLTNIAKFYAIVNEKDKIQINVKFNNENKFRKLKTVDKAYFIEGWKLPEKSKIIK